MHIEPQSPRFSCESIPGGIQAIVPARRNWFVILFMSAWLFGWFSGEASAIEELISPDKKTPQLFMAVWLIGWTIGGIFAFGAVLWQLVGREVISITSSALEHRIEILGIARSRIYRIGEIRNLRAAEFSTNPFTSQTAWFPSVVGSGFGPVAFDYGARTMRVAPSLEEAEAKLLVERLSAHLPRNASAI